MRKTTKCNKMYYVVNTRVQEVNTQKRKKTEFMRKKEEKTINKCALPPPQNSRSCSFRRATCVVCFSILKNYFAFVRIFNSHNWINKKKLVKKIRIKENKKIKK